MRSVVSLKGKPSRGVVYICVSCWMGAQAGQRGDREQMSVIDGGCLNGELLGLSFCKLVRTDAITLTVDTRPSITFTQSSDSLQIQMGMCVHFFFFSGTNIKNHDSQTDNMRGISKQNKLHLGAFILCHNACL